MRNEKCGKCRELKFVNGDVVGFMYRVMQVSPCANSVFKI